VSFVSLPAASKTDRLHLQGAECRGPENERNKGVIYYLCLQATREGQASHAHVHEIIAGLRRNGWQVTLFEPGYSNDYRRIGLWRRIWHFTLLQFKLWMTGKRPDLLYIRSHHAVLPTLVSAKIRRVKTILEVNGTFEDISLSYPWTRAFWPLVDRIGCLCLTTADAVIAVTPEIAHWVKQRVGKEQVFVVPNGANVDLFRPDAERCGLLPFPYVSFVGALSRWQGINILLRAIDDHEWPAEVKLVIVGDGSAAAAVEQKAARNSSLVYLGRRPYREIPGIVAGGIAGLSPQTDSQGRAGYGLYPLKVFETLSCGVPAIVTDFSGQRDIIREYDCGIVVPPEDSAAIARAVASLFAQPERCREMGLRGRRAVEEGFSWQRRADATDEIIATTRAQHFYDV
jgi:glycosyltransferase involved in cell wall biosynthesis